MAGTTRRSTAAKSATTLDIDFKGVESRSDCADGEYTLTCIEVSKEKGDAADYLKFKWGIGDTGAIGYDNKSLAKQSLWSLKQLLEYMGFEVPDGPLKLELKDLVGETVGGMISHEEYNGKRQIRITDFFAIDTGEVSENGSDDSDTSGDEKYKADEVAEMGEDDLADIVKTHSLSVKLAEHKTLRKKANAVIDALEEKDLLETD